MRNSVTYPTLRRKLLYIDDQQLHHLCHFMELFVPMIGEIFLGIIDWYPSVCKSNRLHVDILWFSFIKLRYILSIPLEWSVILQSWVSTNYFSNSTCSFVTNYWLSLIIAPFKCAISYLGMSMFNSILRCVPLLNNGLQVDEQCIEMTLGISMLRNFFLLHTEM